MTIIQGMPAGLRYKIGALPRTKNSDTQFQGGGFSWGEKLGLLFARGTTTEDAAAMLTYTNDGGLNWEPPVRESNVLSGGVPETNALLLPYSETYALHASVVRDSRLYVLSKGDHTPQDPAFYKLYGKAIKRYEVQFIRMDTVNGTNVIDVYWPLHGLKGDGLSGSDSINMVKLSIPPSALTSVGGIPLANITGNRLITWVSRDRFKITIPTKNATATGSFWGTVGITFQPGGWREETYQDPAFPSDPLKRLSWENAVLAYCAPLITSITMAQHFVQTASGKWFTALSGNRKGVLQIPDPIGGPVSDFVFGDSLERCSGDGPGTPKVLTEPTLASGGGERVFGFIRTQGLPNVETPEFFWSDNAGLSISTSQQRKINDPIMSRCPISCALGDNGYVYGFGMERLTTYTGDNRRRAAYLLVAHKDQAFSTATGMGGAAFAIHEIGDVNIHAFSDAYAPPAYGGAGASSEASNTGLPTVVKHGSWIVFFYEETELGAFTNTDGGTTVRNSWCNIKYLAIDTSPVNKPLSTRGMMGE